MWAACLAGGIWAAEEEQMVVRDGLAQAVTGKQRLLDSLAQHPTT